MYHYSWMNNQVLSFNSTWIYSAIDIVTITSLYVSTSI